MRSNKLTPTDIRMNEETFLKLDYLVFSSHKTMTQSIRNTLTYNGMGCVHAHRLSNLGLSDDHFRYLCNEYVRKNNRKLQVISVFRDPMERMISSFFQSLSVEKWGRTNSGAEFSLRELPIEAVIKESILFSEDFESIEQRFWYYCAKVDGFGESLHDLTRIFDIQLSEIEYHPIPAFSSNECECVDLHVSRFDLMRIEFIQSLERLVGRSLTLQKNNISEEKWYYDKYKEFRENVRIPKVFVTNMYESRRRLCQVFYKGGYSDLLQQRLLQYS